MLPKPRSPRSILSSWKEIAAHFGVTIRTVQLWETERGLPVHRMPGIRGRVYAYTDELDAWTKPADIVLPELQVRERSLGMVHAASIAMLVLLALGLAAWLMRPGPVPSSWTFSGRTLIVNDANGNVLWRHEFPQGTRAVWERPAEQGGEPESRPLIVDLDGDGKREVLFTRAPDDVGPGSLNEELVCFDSAGNVRWTYAPGAKVSTSREQFPPPYRIRAVVARESGPGKAALLLVASFHSIHFPSQLAALSPQGKVEREYWHSGHMAQVFLGDLDGDGSTELYLTAFHNVSKSAAVIALDPRNFGGASEEADPAYQLTGMDPAREMGRILIPQSEMTRRIPSNAGPYSGRLQDGRLFLSVIQQYQFPALRPYTTVDYQIGPRLSIISGEYSAAFEGAYKELVERHAISPYDLDADLERIKKVEVATPWREHGADAQR